MSKPVDLKDMTFLQSLRYSLPYKKVLFDIKKAPPTEIELDEMNEQAKDELKAETDSSNNTVIVISANRLVPS